MAGTFVDVHLLPPKSEFSEKIKEQQRHRGIKEIRHAHATQGRKNSKKNNGSKRSAVFFSRLYLALFITDNRTAAILYDDQCQTQIIMFTTCRHARIKTVSARQFHVERVPLNALGFAFLHLCPLFIFLLLCECMRTRMWLYCVKKERVGRTI